MDDELCEGLRVGHGFGGEDLTLGQGRRGEGLTLSRGGMVNGKLEAHIRQTFQTTFTMFSQSNSRYLYYFIGAYLT